MAMIVLCKSFQRGAERDASKHPPSLNHRRPAKTGERHAWPSLIGVGVGLGIGISQCWYHDSIFPYHADHICQHAQ
jgi:hypothetical protein